MRSELFIDYRTKVSRETLMHDGAFMAYVDGGYPFLYRTDSGATLCAPCATTNDVEHEEDLVLGTDIFYEGAPETCDGCNAEIESAYGDPDQEA